MLKRQHLVKRSPRDIQNPLCGSDLHPFITNPVFPLCCFGPFLCPRDSEAFTSNSEPGATNRLFLGGNFDPEKKYLAPPPKNTLTSPERPPPPGIFIKKKKRILASRTPPSPPPQKNNKYPKRPPRFSSAEQASEAPKDHSLEVNFSDNSHPTDRLSYGQL